MRLAAWLGRLYEMRESTEKLKDEPPDERQIHYGNAVVPRTQDPQVLSAGLIERVDYASRDDPIQSFISSYIVHAIAQNDPRLIEQTTTSDYRSFNFLVKSHALGTAGK